MPDEQMYLVTFSCQQGSHHFHAETLCRNPVDALIDIRKAESERIEKQIARGRSRALAILDYRQFNIVNIVEVSATQAEALRPPPAITAEQIKAMFGKLAGVKPDAIVEENSK